MKLKAFIQENKYFVIALLIASIVYFMGVFLIHSDRIDRKDDLIALQTSVAVSHYKDVLLHVTHNIEIIETFVLSEGIDNITTESFADFIMNYKPHIVGFVSVSIAPDGIIEFYYSEEYDDGLIGHDLVNDERSFVEEAVAYAIENRVIVINGPFDLLQGNQGVVFRKPVFEGDEFVGLINYVVDYDHLETQFQDTELYAVDTGIFDADNSLIFGDGRYSKSMYLYQEIDVNYVDWFIGIDVNDEFARQELIRITMLGFAFIIMYVVMFYLWTKYYRKTKSYIKYQNQLIHYDNLTLLPNRRLFVEETKKRIKNNQQFYLGFGDLDNFKNINDVLGHSVGDQYLVFVSEKLKQMISDTLHIYRWGGDEFIFVFLDNNRQDVIQKIDRVFDIFKTPFDINGSKHQISISIGLVNYPKDSDNLDDLVRRADIVMYDIKAHYKNTYSFFEEEYLEELYRTIHFQQELDQYAISDFEVYFQPIVDINTSKIVGFEALSRLFDTNKEPFNTQAIIKQYEKDGTITNLDKHVFHQACISLNKINKMYGQQYFITLNISPLSLNYDYIDYLKRTARSYHINTKYIVIEIIETLGFKDVEISVELLNEIKKLGFQIAMDDFGMGYSSLSYIAKLPLDIIKIDRSFIHTYESDAFNRTILNTVQDISDSLHLKTLVEGIETEKQLEFVRSLGVQYYQGYLHSKPQPFEDILILLKNK